MPFVKEVSPLNKRKFFLQGAALTAVSLFLRVLSMGYRSFLSQRIGAQGMGLYQLIFSIFLLAVTLSTSGISLAVTRMVTAAITRGRRNTLGSLVGRCFAFCLCLSLSISALLFFASDWAAARFLGDPAAASCLRILGLGLPFMSVCTCMKGYFLAVEESLSTAFADTLEQLLTIGATAALFWRFAPKSIEQACFWAMAASTLGEMCSCTVSWIKYRQSLARNGRLPREKSSGVLRGLAHIALPCTLSSAARSALNTGENLLIPRQLRSFGLNYQASLSQYGLLQGMAMPVLYFPSSFLTSFASLLIPKISGEREQDHKNAVAHITGLALQAALAFGLFFAGLFLFFGEDWGAAFYKSESAGVYLRVLSPIVPLIYLDVVVDSLLKGMDQQFNSMLYNCSDSAIRVILVLLLLPVFGMESYIAILFFSTIFNAALSLHRLLRVTQVRLSLPRQVLFPLGLALAAGWLGRMALGETARSLPLLRIGLETGLCGSIFCLGYFSPRLLKARKKPERRARHSSS